MTDYMEYAEYDDWVECWQCSGDGRTAGCFEDCCSGADCDPDDTDLCCSPRLCDVCKGGGGWHATENATPPQTAER